MTTPVLAAAEWTAIGTDVRVVVTDTPRLDDARELLTADLADLDLACSRFRPDSEVSRLQDAAGRPVPVSPLLAEAVDVALAAAARTGGDLDPTLGTALADLGYDRDFGEVRRLPGGASVRLVRRVPGWRRVHLDRRAGTLSVPPGTLLDLGATAKAWAADRSAARIADRLGCGVLVSLGGDIATAGPPPPGGWVVHVQDRPEGDDGTGCTVVLPEGGALATSSTTSRTWRQGPHLRHHVLDPRTLQPAEAVWRYVTVAAARCADANVASTTALIRGHRARSWLTAVGLPARLVGADGTVRTVGAWPHEVPPVTEADQSLLSPGAQPTSQR